MQLNRFFKKLEQELLSGKHDLLMRMLIKITSQLKTSAGNSGRSDR